MINVVQLLRDVDECFDWLVRGSAECTCGDCRQCFSDEVAKRVGEYVAKLPKPEPKRVIVIGNVVDNLSFGKYCVLNQEQADKANAENHLFVCEKAHEDGSYAYLCGGQYCRCSE